MRWGWLVSDPDPATATDSIADCIAKSDGVAKSNGNGNSNGKCDVHPNVPDVNHAIVQPDRHSWLGLVQRRQPGLLPR